MLLYGHMVNRPQALAPVSAVLCCTASHRAVHLGHLTGMTKRRSGRRQGRCTNGVTSMRTHSLHASAMRSPTKQSCGRLGSHHSVRVAWNHLTLMLVVLLWWSCNDSIPHIHVDPRRKKHMNAGWQQQLLRRPRGNVHATLISAGRGTSSEGMIKGLRLPRRSTIYKTTPPNDLTRPPTQWP